jgi:histidinol-phosphate aminotransferase
MTERIRPEPKPGILDIAPYVGGKSHAPGVEKPIKLSSNENPLGAGMLARAAYAEALSDLAVYPDGKAGPLRAATADHHGLEPERLIFGNGSDEVFHVLNQAWLEPGDNIVSSQYAFLAYQISALACQAEVRLAPEPDLKIEVEGLLGLIDDRTRLVYVSNPANPTGSYLTGEEVRRLHADIPPHILLVVDEAYAEFADAPDFESAFDLARTAENVVVTRTFSKIHGLAGLRVGFGYVPAPVADATERIRQPFNVSIPALAGAVAALSDAEHLKASQELVRSWRPRLIQTLRGLGYDALPSQANFILVRFPGGPEQAEAANAHLLSRGLIVRAVGGYGLPDALRITIGTDDQNRAVLDALGEFAAG